MAEAVEDPVEEDPAEAVTERPPGSDFFYLINNQQRRPASITSSRVRGTDAQPERQMKSRTCALSHYARNGGEDSNPSNIWVHMLVDTPAHRAVAEGLPENGGIKMILDTPEELRDAILRGPLSDKIFEEAINLDMQGKYHILHAYVRGLTNYIGRGYYPHEVYESGILDGLPSSSHESCYIVPSRNDPYLGDAPEGVIQMFLTDPRWIMTPCQKCGSVPRIYARMSYSVVDDSIRKGLVSLDTNIKSFFNKNNDLQNHAQFVVACTGCEQRVMVGRVADLNTIPADWNSVQDDRKAGRPPRRAQEGSGPLTPAEEPADAGPDYTDVDDFLGVELAGMGDDLISIVKSVHSEATAHNSSTIVRKSDGSHAVIGNSRGAVEIVNLNNGLRMSFNLTELTRRQ